MKKQTSPEKALNWSRDESIAVPSPDSEGRMAIRCSDWARIKRKLSDILKPPSRLQIVYSILFGVAGSSALSIIPLAIAKNLPAWVLPLYICVFLFSLVGGSVFVYVEKENLKKRRADIKEIETDMNEIESVFELEREDPGRLVRQDHAEQLAEIKKKLPFPHLKKK